MLRFSAKIYNYNKFNKLSYLCTKATSTHNLTLFSCFIRLVRRGETLMETTRIELTPEQKGVLAALSQETGEPVNTLIDKALEDLQGRVRTPTKGFKEALRSLGLEGLDLERLNGPDRPETEWD
jgi:hypothetical protein